MTADPRAWDHALVHEEEIAERLTEGWEPTPNVWHVVSHSVPMPPIYVFMRRLKSERPDDGPG